MKLFLCRNVNSLSDKLVIVVRWFPRLRIYLEVLGLIRATAHPTDF